MRGMRWLSSSDSCVFVQKGSMSKTRDPQMPSISRMPMG